MRHNTRTSTPVQGIRRIVSRRGQSYFQPRPLLAARPISQVGTKEGRATFFWLVTACPSCLPSPRRWFLKLRMHFSRGFFRVRTH